jgi:enediyne biosynthesis protein E4
VRLKGPSGNPTGVGARITVLQADGSAETAEVAAGSGYYSQSSAECFFGYPDGLPPKKIRVLWSSGTVSEADYPAGAATVVVASSP